jgi:hypothetical protein
VLRETDVARISEMCDARVPSEARDEVRVELERERQAINIVERRPPWRDDLGPDLLAELADDPICLFWH